MIKPLTIATLTFLSLSATASDTFYIKDFEHVVSKTRILDEQGYRIGNYEARFVGKALMGSTNPGKKVDIRLRTMIEYYGEALSHAQEIVRTTGAESCLNMANQLRLSGNNSLALKLTVPSKAIVAPHAGAIQYIVDHDDGDTVHHHMGFECELVLPPGPVTRFDGATDWAPQTQNEPTRY
jgi:hypothetical protein